MKCILTCILTSTFDLTDMYHFDLKSHFGRVKSPIFDLMENVYSPLFLTSQLTSRILVLLLGSLSNMLFDHNIGPQPTKVTQLDLNYKTLQNMSKILFYNFLTVLTSPQGLVPMELEKGLFSS